jgi:hypothetical protein
MKSERTACCGLGQRTKQSKISMPSHTWTNNQIRNQFFSTTFILREASYNINLYDLPIIFSWLAVVSSFRRRPNFRNTISNMGALRKTVMDDDPLIILSEWWVVHCW